MKISKKKIIILTPSYLPNLNGMSYAAHEHAKILNQLGHRVHIITNEFSKINDKVDINNNINVISVNINGNGLLWSPIHGDIKNFENTISKINPDIIISEGWYTWGTHLIPRIKKICKRIILFSHGSNYTPPSFNLIFIVRILGYFYYDFLYKKNILKSISNAILLSEYNDEKRFSDYKDFQENKIPTFIIPNSTSLKPIKIPREKVENYSIGIIGEMSKNKNQLDALKNCSSSKKLKIIYFFYPKENNYSIKVKKMAAKNASIKIEFIEGLTRNEIGEKLQKIDLLVVASHTEAQPLVVIDAISQGIPFLSTKVGCIEEIEGGVTTEIGKFSYNIDKFFTEQSYYHDKSKRAIEYYTLNHDVIALKRRFEKLCTY